MPLSSDAQVVETSNGLVATLHGVAGPHPGFRPGASALHPLLNPKRPNLSANNF
jgi:catalase